jgi:hypothetical protein
MDYGQSFVPGRNRNTSVCHDSVQTSSGVLQPSYVVGSGASFQGTEQVGSSGNVLTCIWEVLGLSFSWDTVYPDLTLRVFLCFISPSQMLG